MAQVLIRNLDDETVAAYREAAERNARSLEAELREALRAMRPRTKAEIDALRDRAAAIRAMTPPVPQTPAVELIGEDRDGYRGA